MNVESFFGKFFVTFITENAQSVNTENTPPCINRQTIVCQMINTKTGMNLKLANKNTVQIECVVIWVLLRFALVAVLHRQTGQTPYTIH
jgi:hypothetical protein